MRSAGQWLLFLSSGSVFPERTWKSRAEICSLGMPQSPRIGEILNILLEKVIAGEIPNKREVLMQEAVRLAAESCLH